MTQSAGATEVLYRFYKGTVVSHRFTCPSLLGDEDYRYDPSSMQSQVVSTLDSRCKHLAEQGKGLPPSDDIPFLGWSEEPSSVLVVVRYEASSNRYYILLEASASDNWPHDVSNLIEEVRDAANRLRSALRYLPTSEQFLGAVQTMTQAKVQEYNTVVEQLLDEPALHKHQLTEPV